MYSCTLGPWFVAKGETPMRGKRSALHITGKPLIAVLVLAFSAILAPPASKADSTKNAVALDRLFAQLRIAPDEHTARSLESKIWAIWTQPDDPALAAKISDLLAARGAGDIKGAKKLADAMVKAWPDYAEGWNERATLEYMLGESDASLADIAKTLKLEPRHFGAISGRILIELQRGERAKALKDLREVLKLDPYMRERALFPGLLPPPTRT